MAVQSYMLKMIIGSTFRASMTIESILGQPYDLSGSALWWAASTAIAENHEPEIEMYWEDLGNSNGISVPAPSTGRIIIEVPVTITSVAMPVGAHHHELRLRDQFNRHHTVMTGVLIVERGVTDSLLIP